MGWEFLEGHTVNEFLEQIERMIAYQARLFLSDPSLNPFNPLPESVDSSPRQQRQLNRMISEFEQLTALVEKLGNPHGEAKSKAEDPQRPFTYPEISQ